MSKLIAVIILFITTISISSVMQSIDFEFSYAQKIIDSDLINNNIINLQDIVTKQARVGDIDISYKTFGKGDPILLIMGYAGSMYAWDPVFLKELSTNHTVIIFASYCGGNQSIPPNRELFSQMTNRSASTDDIKKRIIPLLFTSNWIKQNPDYLEKFASFVFPPMDILERQGKAIFSWGGICDLLKDIYQEK